MVGILKDFLFESKTKKLSYFKVGKIQNFWKTWLPPPLWNERYSKEHLYLGCLAQFEFQNIWQIDLCLQKHSWCKLIICLVFVWGPSRSPTRDPTRSPSRNPTRSPSRNPTRSNSQNLFLKNEILFSVFPIFTKSNFVCV